MPGFKPLTLISLNYQAGDPSRNSTIELTRQLHWFQFIKFVLKLISVKSVGLPGLESISSSSSGISPPTSRRSRPNQTNDQQIGRHNIAELQYGRQNVVDVQYGRQNVTHPHLGRQDYLGSRPNIVEIDDNRMEIVRQKNVEIVRPNPLRMIKEHSPEKERWVKPPRPHRRR